MHSIPLSRRNFTVRDICQALDYRGRLVALGNTYGRSQLTLGGTYWDGGSRTTWHAYDVIGRQLVDLPRNAPVEYGGAPAHTVDLTQLPEGVIVIAHDIVGGKDRGLRLFPSECGLNFGAPSPLGSRAQLQITAGSAA